MRVLVIIGPSGTGKSTVVRELHERGVIDVLPSWTTRPRRPDESDKAIEHRFVSEEEFVDAHKAGGFLEVVELFGFRYGFPVLESAVARAVPTMVLRAPLLDLAAKHFPNHVVYQMESRLEVARARIEGRGGSQEEGRERLRTFGEELTLGRNRCARLFDTSDPLVDVVAMVERAVEQDFLVERSRL